MGNSVRAACTVLVCLTAIAASVIEARTQESRVPKQSGQCRDITETDLRLKCLQGLIGQSDPNRPADSVSEWRQSRSPNQAGGREIVSIMKTADAFRSSEDFAGIIIRCADPAGLEVLIALIKPMPPRMKTRVSITAGAMTTQFLAETTAIGSTLLLPSPADGLATKVWPNTPELKIQVIDNGNDMTGIVQVAGLAQAITRLTAGCASRN